MFCKQSRRWLAWLLGKSPLGVQGKEHGGPPKRKNFHCYYSRASYYELEGVQPQPLMRAGERRLVERWGEGMSISVTQYGEYVYGGLLV